MGAGQNRSNNCLSKVNEFIGHAAAYPGHLVRLAQWKFGFCRNLRRHPPIFVYQLGKVASKAIRDSLVDVYKGEVIHGHGFEANHKQGECRELHEYWFSSRPPKRLFIISPVREPIGRNISAFFENFKKRYGVPPEESGWSIGVLKQRFLEDFEHSQPLNWFDLEMKRYFDLDVYSHDFPPEGYCEIVKERVRLLVFRVELNDQVKIDCMSKFLGIEPFPLTKVNVGSCKSYQDLYRKFLQEVKLPVAYVDAMCESKYFRHFYPDEFIDSVRRKWVDNL